jgi:hypothetical protein
MKSFLTDLRDGLMVAVGIAAAAVFAVSLLAAEIAPAVVLVLLALWFMGKL